MSDPVAPPSAVNPAELLRHFLGGVVDPELAPGGVVVGPASDAQQQSGVVSIVHAGRPRDSLYTATKWARLNVRCVARTLFDASRLGHHVYLLLEGRGRTLVAQPSTGEEYLVHLFNMAAGPSDHYDSPETWESLLVVEMLVGTDPVTPA